MDIFGFRMRFFTSLSFSLVFSIQLVLAQSDAVIDSLQAIVENAGNDTSKINALSQLAFELGYNDNTAGLSRCREALSLAKNIGFQKGVHAAQAVLGRLLFERGDLDSAMIFYNRALPYFEKKNEKRALRNLYKNIGVVHQERKSFDDAFDHYKRALTISEELGDLTMLGNAYNDLGSLIIARGYNAKNDSSNYQNYFKEAASYYAKAIEYFEQAHYRRGTALANGNLAIIDSELKQFKTSLEYARKALDYFEEMGYDYYRTISYNRMAQTYHDMGQYGDAIVAANKALEIAKRMESKLDMRDAYARLSEATEKQGNYKQALEYHKLFNDTHFQIVNEQTQKNIEELEEAYQARKKEEEIAKLNVEKALQKQELKNQQILLVASILVIALVGVLCLVLYLSVRRKSRINRLLSEQKEEIKTQNELLEEKNRLIGSQNQQISGQNEKLRALNEEQKNLIAVVAHDLISPLNKIKGLTHILELSGEMNPEQQSIKEKIDEVSESGRSLISKLTSLLSFENNDFKVTYQKIGLNTLVQQMVNDHNAYAGNKNIQLHFEGLPEELEVDTNKDLLTRIVDNLLSNAIKFSPAGKDVYVRVMEEDKGCFTVIVHDQGPGIGQADQAKLFRKFQRLSAQPTAGETSTGLGLSIVKSLVDRLEGKISVKSEEGEGASFKVSFPINRKIEIDLL